MFTGGVFQIGKVSISLRFFNIIDLIKSVGGVSFLPLRVSFGNGGLGVWKFRLEVFGIEPWALFSLTLIPAVGMQIGFISADLTAVWNQSRLTSLYVDAINAQMESFARSVREEEQQEPKEEN